MKCVRRPGLPLLALSAISIWVVTACSGIPQAPDAAGIDSRFPANWSPKGVSMEMKKILEYGALAPNSHNAQMWGVRVSSADEITVLFNPARALPAVDPKNRESMISIGAFIENLVEAARAYGMASTVSVIAHEATDEKIATIRFTATGDESSKPTLEDIAERHTIRTPFLAKELSDRDLAALRSVGGEIAYFPLATPQGRYLREAIVQSMEKQVDNDAQEAEFADWVRLNDKEARQSHDGLTWTAMGLSGIKRWFASTFIDRRALMSKSFRGQTVETVKAQASSCAGFVVVSSPDNSVESLINAGRVLERFWLAATRLKIAVHPMSSALEERPWNEELAGRVGVGPEVQMLLRVGYVKDYGGPDSLRIEVPIEE